MTQAQAPQAKDKKTVLAIEDDQIFAKILAKELREAGFNVLLAKDGKAGLETALKEHPDLTLLDIVLPGMDGIEVLKQIRTDKWGKSALVIMLTQLGTAEKIAEALESGPLEYLVKSDYTIPEVVQKVKTHFAL